jgi:hypothetical protein
MEHPMTNLFKDAFAPLKPLIIADFEAYVTRTSKRYADTWDTMSDAAKLNIRRGYDVTWRFASRFAIMDSDRANARPTGEVNAAWLRKNAEENAAAQIAAFAAKLESKLGTLGDFQATFTRGADFTISGTRNGHRVFVEQQTVFKVSSHGTPFNQFPARIYVDGKFTPAAKYEAAVA